MLGVDGRWGRGGLVGGGCGGELFELDLSRFRIFHCRHRSGVWRAEFAGKEREGGAETVRGGDYDG